MTVASYLVHGPNIPALDAEKFTLLELPPGATCAITGDPIAQGYSLWKIIPDSTSERLDLTRSSGQWIGEIAARAWKNSWNLGSRLIFEDGTHYHPLIARDAARKRERPCWTELVREIWPKRKGQSVLMILATDVKKKVWPQAKIGPLGTNTPIYVHASATSGVVMIDWQKLINTLDFVETVYAAGFTKADILDTLLHSRKAVQAVGLKETLKWEKQLRKYSRSQLLIATLVAQKTPPEPMLDLQMSLL